MGFLDSILGKKDYEKELAGKTPFVIRLSLMPFRLAANRKDKTVLTAYVRNISGQTVMSSIVIDLPKQLGFDETGLTHRKEFRIGQFKPDESKNLNVEIWSNTSTNPADYNVTVTTFMHYRDYSHFDNKVTKTEVLRAVKQ
ncbi:Uncharacterised protein [Candidatus Gugararchaeum adminiculabundum]|nr:Uncharacterised protein [Candidatus Gugararchaeum adminiculabundum]